MNKLKEVLNKNPKQRILDVGTGAGSFIHFLNHLLEDYSEIIGVDTHERSLEMATKSFESEDRIKFIQADILDNAFEAESFDIVVLSNTMHHLTNLDTVMKEMLRLCKPNGFVLVNEMVSDNLDEMQKSHMYLHHFAAEIDNQLGMYHGYTYAKQEIIDLLADYNTVNDSWEMDVERRESNTDQEIEQMLTTVDRLLARTEQFDNKEEYVKKAEEIKEYIKNNGYDGASSIVTIMRKEQ